MNRFLGNNKISLSLQTTNRFINIIDFLNVTFYENPITIYYEQELSVIEIQSLNPLRKLVGMDEPIEYNLRMIESYLPELLLAFSIVANKEESLNHLIQRLSSNKFPFPKSKYSKVFLQCKIISFIETLLFVDIFSNPWNGELQTDICYVYKEKAELQFYHYYQIRPLLLKLFDKISINSIDLRSKIRKCRKISFEIKK